MCCNDRLYCTQISKGKENRSRGRKRKSCMEGIDEILKKKNEKM